MASQIDIVNLALLELGEATIASLTEGTSAAITMNAIYTIVRQELLRKHRWSFSRRQANLAALAAEPIWNYSHQIQLPSDCLQLIGIKGYTSDPSYTQLGVPDAYPTYQIYGRTIYINDAGPIYIDYVGDITDTTLFDSAFVTAFAMALATRAAQRITQSNSIAQVAEGKYMQAIRDAVRANAIEIPPVAIQATSYTLTRSGGG